LQIPYYHLLNKSTISSLYQGFGILPSSRHLLSFRLFSILHHPNFNIFTVTLSSPAHLPFSIMRKVILMLVCSLSECYKIYLARPYGLWYHQLEDQPELLP